MDISSFLSVPVNIIQSIDKWKGNKDAQRNALLIECKFNLNLLDLLKSKNASQELANEIYKALSIVAFEAIMAYGDKNEFSFLFKSVLDKEHEEKEIRMVSVIVKMKMLKQIVLLEEKFPGQLKPLINTRLEHIKSLHLEILNYLNQNSKKLS